MPDGAVGEIQSSPYGHRVCLTLGSKVYYGPYRTTIDCAKADLAKLPSDKGISVRKKEGAVLGAEVGRSFVSGCRQYAIQSVWP